MQTRILKILSQRDSVSFETLRWLTHKIGTTDDSFQAEINLMVATGKIRVFDTAFGVRYRLPE